MTHEALEMSKKSTARVMKISLRGDELDTRLYNRENGQGAAEAVIEALRSNAQGNRPRDAA